MTETIRGRLEQSYHEGAGAPHDFGRMFLTEWRAGNLIAADEVEARIAEAVAAERARATKIVQQARFGERDNDLRSVIYAIESGEDPAAIRDGGNHDG